VQLTDELAKAKSFESSRNLLEAQQNEAHRLAKQVDVMMNEKSALENRCNRLELDNKELSENFLYIKNKYDVAVQEQAAAQSATLASVESAANAAEYKDRIKQLESKLSSVEAALEATVAEKNRVNKRADSLSRDLDKSRVQMDNATQRLVETNKQLLDEKTATDKELEHIRKLFDEQSSQLRSLTNSPMYNFQAAPFVVGLDDTNAGGGIEEIKKQLEFKCEEVKKLQLENQTLKSRVRKLAAM